METKTTRILLVEDHELLAQSVGLALRAEAMQVEIADLSSLETLVAAVTADPPDLVLLDLELGGEIGDGTRLIRPFSRTGARVLVVSAVAERHRLAAAVEQGAIGLVSKSGSFDALLDTILAAARGEDILPADERYRLITELRCHRERTRELHAPFERLTRREQQVLEALADGSSVATIAAQWVVSEATVRSQVRGVLSKLGVCSQLEAVAYASRAGWLSAAE